MFETDQIVIEESIKDYLVNNNLPGPYEFTWSPIPFSGEWGISTSFYRIAAQEARSGKNINVAKRAEEIASAVAGSIELPGGLDRVESTRGYLNLYFSSTEYCRRVLDAVLTLGENFGRGVQNKKKVMVEYSQPNTHKPLHVGHLRNMILGASICNILEYAGYDVIRANYPGDTGLHVIKWMWNYLENHAGENPGKDKIQWMGDIYTEANRLLEENPEFEGEIREIFRRWEKKDPEIMALWKKTRQWSLDGFNQVYDILDIKFDRYYYQSDVEEPGKKLVDDLVRREIAIDERPSGPVIVRLDELLGLKKEKYRVMVVLRSDGTSLYSTWDLALAIQKFKDYELTKSIYVIDVRQSLHLQQVFKTLELMGYQWTDRLHHLPYEIVNLPGNVTMKSREGTVVRLETLISEAIKRARDIVDEKNPALPIKVKESVSNAVALGAIKYPILARENTKIATFDWDRALDFEGHAAPYIQYAHVRASSILRKAKEYHIEPITPSYPLEQAEIELIDLISRTPSEIQRAADELKTLHITNLAYDIARSFSDFYNQCPVLSAESVVRANRLRIVAATKQTIANLLALLGIASPEVM